MDDNTMTETIRARCTPELKQRLEALTRQRAGDISDHIRFAIETYVASIEAQPTTAQPTTAQPEPA
jgi:predicted DNA-binding protein